MNQNWKTDPAVINEQFLDEKRQESEAKKKDNLIFELVRASSNQIQTSWDHLMMLMSKHEQYEENPDQVNEERKIQKKRNFSRFILFVIFLGEVMISWEAAGILANGVATVCNLETRPALLYLICALILPMIVVAGLRIAKSKTNTASIKANLTKLGENFGAGQMSKGVFRAQLSVYAKEKRRKYGGKFAYLLALSTFYFGMWGVVRGFEAEMQALVIDEPNLSEMVFGEGNRNVIDSPAKPIAESSNLPYSTFLGYLTFILIVIHFFAIFDDEEVDPSRVLQYGDYNPERNMKQIARERHTVSKETDTTVALFTDPENEQIIDRMMMLIPAPIRAIMNNIRQEEIFYVPPGTTYPELPESHSYAGMRATYAPNDNHREMRQAKGSHRDVKKLS